MAQETFVKQIIWVCPKNRRTWELCPIHGHYPISTTWFSIDGSIQANATYCPFITCPSQFRMVQVDLDHDHPHPVSKYDPQWMCQNKILNHSNHNWGLFRSTLTMTILNWIQLICQNMILNHQYWLRGSLVTI